MSNFQLRRKLIPNRNIYVYGFQRTHLDSFLAQLFHRTMRVVRTFSPSECISVTMHYNAARLTAPTSISAPSKCHRERVFAEYAHYYSI